MSKVFVSYSRADTEFAKRLTAELKKSDLDYWIDWEGIPATVDWWKEIEKGIEESDAFIFLISPDSVASPICNQEIEHAVKNGKRLIPLVVRDIPKETKLEKLGHINYIFFRQQDDFDAGIQRLLTSIHTDFEWVKQHRRLQMRALEWEHGFKDNSFLLRGKDLTEAAKQVKENETKDPVPTTLQREYVNKSRRAVRRQRWAIVLTVFVVTVICMLSVFSVFQWQMAVRAREEAMIAEATAIAVRATGQAEYNLLKSQSANQSAALAEIIASHDGSEPVVPTLLAAYSLQAYPNDKARTIVQNYLRQNGKATPDADEELIAGACSILPRNLTQAEWDKYIGGEYMEICPGLPMK